MKRSDIIQLIHNYTSTLNILNGDMTIDEHILEIIEKAGMLPPFIEAKAYGFNELPEWEPEDEFDSNGGYYRLED